MDNVLVAYFSRAGENYGYGGIIHLEKGNTEILAEAIADDLDAQLFKIEAVNPYPKDYYATTDQAKVELREDARPEISGPLPDMSGIDTIVLGYPNFCTNEGSGLGGSVRDLSRTYPAAKVMAGLSVRGTDAARSCKKAQDWARKSVR